jgi:hypothetical protein
MPRLPVDGQEILPPEGERESGQRWPRRPIKASPRPPRRLTVRRTILSALILSLAAWLVSAANAPSSGPIERILLLLLAVLLPLHLVFFQLDGMRLLERTRGWPRALRAAALCLALAASPMVLYPLGLIAIAVSLFAGGAATPALAVAGGLMLAPIVLILGLGLLMALAHKLRR